MKSIRQAGARSWGLWSGSVLACSVLGACISTDQLPLGDAPGGAAGGAAQNSAGSAGQSAAPSGGVGGSSVGDGGGTVPGNSCQPLDPVTSSVTLLESDVVDAGTDTDGTVYVLTDVDSNLRLFVGTGGTLQEQFEAGTGQGTMGSVQFWTLEYDDATGTQVTVEVQKDAAGTRMGVVHGPISGKGFDVGSVGSVLTPLDAATAVAMPTTTTMTFHVEYAGSGGSETVVLIAPDHEDSFDGFRLFLGPLSAMTELPNQVMVSRGLSIPSTTIVDFTFPDGSPAGAASSLRYSGGSPDATLTIGADVTPLTGTASNTLPAGAVFYCAAN